MRLGGRLFRRGLASKCIVAEAYLFVKLLFRKKLICVQVFGFLPFQEARREIFVVHWVVKNRSGTSRQRWNDPTPFPLSLSAVRTLIPDMFHELATGGVMVHDRDTLAMEGVKNGLIEFHQGSISPQSSLGSRVQSHPLRDQWQKIVTVYIAQVACPDLRSHIPSAKRGAGIEHTSNFKYPVGHGRQCVPTKTEFFKPGKLRVSKGNLQHVLGRYLSEQWGLVGPFDQ